MFVRILGAHQSESQQTGFTSMVVDEVLAIDAGSLTSRLSLDEQLKLESLLLTHRHWDHVKDVAGFGFNLFSRLMAGLDPSVVNLYGLADVRQILRRNLLATDYWLDFFNPLDSGRPVLRFHEVDENTEFDAGAYRIRTIPSNHTVPTIGFQITNSVGRKLLYTSDNGPGSGENWKIARPDLLITECTYSNAQRAVDSGRMHGHLCPSQLAIELETFGRAHGYLPNVVVLHLNPLYVADIRRELLEVARDLTASIEVSTEGATFAV